MALLGDDFVLTAPDAITRFDRHGQVKFHRSYKVVGNSAGSKAGAVAGYFLLGGFNPTPDRMHAAFSQSTSVTREDERHEYFLFENESGSPDQRFGIVCTGAFARPDLASLRGPTAVSAGRGVSITLFPSRITHEIGFRPPDLHSGAGRAG